MGYLLKRKSIRDAVSPKRRLLLWLGEERACDHSLGVCEERVDVEGSSRISSHSGQINPTLLQEVSKAKALMEIERQRMRVF